jgi:hypothetical protein
MYISLMGTCQQGSGPAALSITLDNEDLELLDLAAPNFEHPVSTGAGQIDVTATAAGGDGSYSYAWTVSELGDDDDTGTGVIQILSAGTTNAAQYNTLTLRSNATPGGPTEASYSLKCTVTDGTGATAFKVATQRVFAVNLG